MLIFKISVSVRGVRPELLSARTIVIQSFQKYGFDCIVTSCTDGDHAGKSFHYNGLAEDYRTKHVLNLTVKMAIYKDIKAALEPLYDVILEGLGTDNEHIHIEFDDGKEEARFKIDRV